MPPPRGPAGRAVLTSAVRGAAPAPDGAATSRPAARATPRAPLPAGRRRMVALMMGPPRFGGCPRRGAVPVSTPEDVDARTGTDRGRTTWSDVGRSQGRGVPAAFPPLAALSAGTQAGRVRAVWAPAGGKAVEPCRADTPPPVSRCRRPGQGPWSLSRAGPGWQGRAGGGQRRRPTATPRDHGERRAGRAPHLHQHSPTTQQHGRAHPPGDRTDLPDHDRGAACGRRAAPAAAPHPGAAVAAAVAPALRLPAEVGACVAGTYGATGRRT